VSAGVKHHRACFQYQHAQPKVLSIPKEDVCPKCNLPVKHETDSIISGGQQYHRACFDIKPQVVRQNTISYVESCPKCNQPVSKGSNDVAPDIIISGGQQYHRACFGIKETAPKVLNISHDEICEICNKSVTQKATRNDSAADVIVSGGKQYHRSCFSTPMDKEPVRVFQQTQDVCPHCSVDIKDRNEAVYKLGQPYHRDCYYASISQTQN